MSQPHSRSSLVSCLRDLHASAGRVWQRYQQHGPGRVDSAFFDEVRGAAARLKDAAAANTPEDTRACGMEFVEIEAIARRLVELARQSACTPQGLSFISGEAGLIPRRDLHQEYEALLESLAGLLGRLQQNS